MFGKTKETSDIDERAELDVSIDDFFGDETAVAEAVRVDQLHERVTNVEQQISSQFTSLAAYAQIAQEQVELVRSEAQHSNERSEQRVVGLIERERADRMEAAPGGGVDVNARLDALDAQVGEIRDGLQQCLSNQKALADAITHLFTPNSDTADASASSIDLAPDATPPATVAAAAPTAPPAPLATAPSAAALNETLPPPPVRPRSLEELDNDLEELGVNMQTDDDFVTIATIQPSTGLFNGPIDGLSLA